MKSKTIRREDESLDNQRRRYERPSLAKSPVMLQAVTASTGGQISGEIIE